MADVNAILSLKKLNQKIEAYWQVRGRDIFSVHYDSVTYPAIDMPVDKLYRQILENKVQGSGHRYNGALEHQPRT